MKVLFVSGKIGSAKMMLPVIKAIGEDIKCLMSQKSRELCRFNEIEYNDADSMTDSEILELVSTFAPDVILTGTRAGLNVEKKIIEIGSQLHFKTVAFVNQWSLYKERFYYMDKTYLPDYIFLIDEIMKKEMIKAGFDESLLVVTGNPFFDNLEKIPDGNKILFISQRFREIIDDNYPGYNEFEVLEDVINVLTELNIKRLVVRPHPLSNRTKFDQIVQKYIGEVLVSLDTLSDINTVLADSKLIIGMTSMVLFQAALGKKAVISYQPHVNPKKDLSILQKLGISSTVKTKEKLKQRIKNMLDGTEEFLVNPKLSEKYLRSDATEAVISLLHDVSEDSA